MVDAAHRSPSIDLATAIGQASGHLATNPAAAKALALQILQALPGHPQPRLVLGSALRRLGQADAATQTLGPLAMEQPDWSAAHYELGMALRALGQEAAAVGAFRQAAAMTPSPDMIPAWRALGDHDMAEAAEALRAKDFHAAVTLLQRRLDACPQDVPAMRMLAELESLRGGEGEAETLLARCLAIAPDAPGLRHRLVVTLLKQFKAAAALVHIDKLLEATPDSPQFLTMRAAALTHLGDCDRAIGMYERLLAGAPAVARLWLSYGDALKIAGRAKDCIAAYRQAIRLAPDLGKAYWSLANLKTVRFTGPEVSAMQVAIGKPRSNGEDRLHLHYALGKAFEDEGRFAQSFTHYEEGARLGRAQTPYEADQTSALVARSRSLFTADFFEARKGLGHEAADPIFVVGLPRSGSTLVEQILASHSAIEGTMELADLGSIAAALGPTSDAAGLDAYPGTVESLDGDRLAALGRRYLETTAVQRRTGKPFFVDKMPHNFFLIGLIQSILPNAKLIDVRRSPIAACFSSFKQHFPAGNRFSCSLSDMGRYYRDYIDLMTHYDANLPGRIHRVRYEELVNDVDLETHRLFEYLGLPFEEGCLRFHDNARVVQTASSEQVRRPIFRESIDQWRNFEPWLDPLKAALGPALHDY